MTHCPQTGKVSYESKSEALQARRKIGERIKRGRTKRRAWERDPYLCKSCGLWHLTSTTPA
jgi:hypothetical protein